jgi:hypothetical protein
VKYERRTPCGSCPYRKDVPAGLWHRAEFENLLRHDANEFAGSTFGCHEGRNKPRDEQDTCIGWLLDQRSRGYPSIQLRMRLMMAPGAGAQAKEAHADGMRLYPSIAAMCRANGVRVRRAP